MSRRLIRPSRSALRPRSRSPAAPTAVATRRRRRSNGGDTVTQGTVPLTVAMPNGQLTNNSNPFSPDSAGNKTGYTWAIYEPLVQTNNYAHTDPVPWLASAFKWSDDYTSVTFTARDGVKWSDGEPFTADDIAYTFNFVALTRPRTPTRSTSRTSGQWLRRHGHLWWRDVHQGNTACCSRSSCRSTSGPRWPTR